ncbi:MAG: polymer-forming cytoskeletal protein [Pseudomonadales bacterium]
MSRTGMSRCPTVRIKGEVSAEEDLTIMGQVEGLIDHDRVLTIHARGVVKAEIKAREVFVQGTVEGNLYGTARVRVEETGRVTGNVLAPRIGVSEGACLKGCIDMESDPAVIEQRFCDSTGRTATGTRAGRTRKGKADSEALSTQAATTINTGDADAAQAAEQRQSDAEAGTESGDRPGSAREDA